MDDLAQLVHNNSELLISREGIASMVQNIPAIVEREEPKKDCSCISFSFIKEVCALYRQKMLKVRTQPDIAAQAPHCGNQWPLTILRCYGRALLTDHRYGEVTEGLTEEQAAQIGWLFLVLDMNNRFKDPATRAMYDGWVSVNASVKAFLQVLADCSLQIRHSDQSCTVMAAIIGRKERTTLSDDGCCYPFFSEAPNMNLEWLNKELESYFGVRDLAFDLEVAEDCTNLFITLSNILRSREVADSYFFEYIGEISYYYPLVQQRQEIAERYDRYFPDAAMIFMADITNEVFECFSQSSWYFEDGGSSQDAAMARIHAKAEDIILEIHRMFPDVAAKVVQLFFRDTLSAFGDGFQHLECLQGIDAIIDKVFQRDEEAQESAVDYLELLCAMEGSYGDDVEDLTGEGSNDDAGTDTGTTSSSDNSTVENASLHKKASGGAKVKTAEAMKEAERKIYSAYHKYKSGEEKVDSTLTRALQAVKRAIVGDQQAVLINGKQFSVVGFVKKLFATVAIFSYSKIAGILFVIVSSVMKKKSKKTEKRALLAELESELEMVNEKIEDAKGDGNREAKYALMRTRNALNNAIGRLKYGMGAEIKEPVANRQYLNSSKDLAGYRG
jgi:hypothetical protein